jgi:hypothetical protein
MIREFYLLIPRMIHYGSIKFSNIECFIRFFIHGLFKIQTYQSHKIKFRVEKLMCTKS